jgi:hypothetical protein
MQMLQSSKKPLYGKKKIIIITYHQIQILKVKVTPHLLLFTAMAQQSDRFMH